jgi:hypothetical protein
MVEFAKLDDFMKDAIKYVVTDEVKEINRNPAIISSGIDARILYALIEYLADGGFAYKQISDLPVNIKTATREYIKDHVRLSIL